MLKIDLRFIKLEVSAAFFALAFIVVALGYAEQFFLLIFCVGLHESAHIFCARRCGLKTSKLVVLPLGFSAQIEELESLRPAKRAAVILAGPAVNAVLAYVSHMFWGYSFFYLINTAYLVFNLLPILPLDGGRFCFIVAASYMGILNANRFIAVIGKIFCAALIAVGIIQIVLFPINVSLMSMGVYLFFRSGEEEKTRIFEFYRNIVIKNAKLSKDVPVPVKAVFVSGGLQKKELLHGIGQDDVKQYFVRSGGAVKVFYECDLIDSVITGGLSGTAADVLREAESKPKL